MALVRLDLDEVRERVLLLFHQREPEGNAQQPEPDFMDLQGVLAWVAVFMTSNCRHHSASRERLVAANIRAYQAFHSWIARLEDPHATGELRLAFCR
jgi:hypothetical protein